MQNIRFRIAFHAFPVLDSIVQRPPSIRCLRRNSAASHGVAEATRVGERQGESLDEPLESLSDATRSKGDRH